MLIWCFWRLSSSFLFSSLFRFSFTALPSSPGAFKSRGGFSYTGFFSSSSPTSPPPLASRRFAALTSPELCLKNTRYPTKVAPTREKINLGRFLLPHAAIVSLSREDRQSLPGVSCPERLDSVGFMLAKWRLPFHQTCPLFVGLLQVYSAYFQSKLKPVQQDVHSL